MIIFGYVGHITLGMAVGVAVCHSPIGVMAITIGSLLPDIDSKRSTLGRYNPLVRFMNHRGHCHSIIGIWILSAPFAFISMEVYSMVLVGAFTHLVGDKIYSFLPKKKNFKIKVW